MDAYQYGQTFTDQRWGTMMPIAVMAGSEIVEVRARGSFSAFVEDPALLTAAEADPENLGGYLRALILAAVNELIGELSSQAASAAELTVVTPAAVQALREKLEPAFKTAGLELQSLTIEAIERV